MRVSTVDGTISRVGYAVLPEDEAKALPPAEARVSVCAQASTDDATVADRVGGVATAAVAQLHCPDGYVIDAIDFASYGTPTGACSPRR